MAHKIDALTRAGIDTQDLEVAVTHYLEVLHTNDATQMQRVFGRRIERFTYGVDKGRRYWRVWRGLVSDKGEVSQRSAVTFVDTHSGDILKPASWKSPVSGARGNVLRM